MTQLIPTKFSFKVRTIRDDSGKEVGKTKKQPSLEIQLPQPTDDELVAILQSQDEALKKVKDLVRDAVFSIVRDQAKGQIDDYLDTLEPNSEETVKPEVIDFDKLDLFYIATLPPAQRGARAIPAEDWEAFFQDYLQVMVEATGKPADKIKNHIELFKKPTRVKQSKDVLEVLVDQLDVYMTASKSLEDTGECATRIREKFNKWVQEDAKFDVSAL